MNNELSIYVLTAQYQALYQQLTDLDLDAATVADTIEASGLQDDIAAKAQGLECIARNLEMYTPAINAEIERLQKLRDARCKKAQDLRECALVNMQAAGIDRIETPLFKIKLQNNPPAVDVFEPGLIPAGFMTAPVAPPPAPNKTAIKNALRAGIDVQGCRLVQGQRLVVS